MEWLGNNTVKITPPSSPKKITGTRFAACLGYNVWKSEFETWCEMTGTYKEPFVDNKYTIAGKTIEPIIDEYLKKSYYMKNLVKPEDIYSQNSPEMLKRDFFLDNEIFGGMWDALLMKDDVVKDEKDGCEILRRVRVVDSVIEIKTSSRPEDWENDIPLYYSLQASLYAWQLGVENVIIVCSFLKDDEYEHPEHFVPTAKNTIVRSFKVHEKFSNFDLLIEKAKFWYSDHVLSGISPQYLKEDEDIIKELKTKYIDPNTDISEIMAEAIKLTEQIAEIEETTKPLQKRLKTLQEHIKEYSVEQFQPNQNNVVMKLDGYTFNTGLSYKKDIDKKALEKDGLLEKYSITKPIYTLRVSKDKEER